MSFEHNDMKHLPINLENYEEYFLLYVDNELTEAEKKSVEFFVARHPELMEEWTMLMETKLEPENITTDLKKDLYRSTETEGIDASNFETFQLSWLDDELNEKDRHAIEMYTSLHPDAAANMELLAKTKLPQEVISFPDKSLLHRTTSTPASVVTFNWYRMAVAAAIIVAAGLWFINKPVEEEIPAALVPIAQVPKTSDSNDTKSATNNSTENKGTATDEETAKGESATEKVQGSVGTTRNSSEDIQSKPSNGLATRIIRDDKNTEKSQAINATVPVSAANNTTPANVDNLNRSRVEDVPIESDPMGATNQLSAKSAVAINVKSDYATEALMSENNETTTEQPDMMEEGKTRKGMFRGIVRKANRFYNKVTNPDPERPLVKVANFEIGLPR
jgi:hypothetical protein